MRELQLWHLKFLAAFLLAMFSGTESASKFACRGDSVELFQNIFSRNDDLFVYLHKNGYSTMMIAMWYKTNLLLNESYTNGYSERVFLDKFGNIWMRNLDITDDANYTITVEIGTRSIKYDMQLTVLAAPKISCKPKILRADNILTADLEVNNCGKPVASVYWQEHPGISLEPKVIKLQPGKEAGVYHACIQGDALKCSKSPMLSEYCSVFVIDENTNTSTLWPVFCIWLTLLTLAVIPMLIFLSQRIIRKKRSSDIIRVKDPLCKAPVDQDDPLPPYADDER